MSWHRLEALAKYRGSLKMLGVEFYLTVTNYQLLGHIKEGATELRSGQLNGNGQSVICVTPSLGKTYFGGPCVKNLYLSVLSTDLFEGHKYGHKPKADVLNWHHHLKKNQSVHFQQEKNN